MTKGNFYNFEVNENTITQMKLQYSTKDCGVSKMSETLDLKYQRVDFPLDRVLEPKEVEPVEDDEANIESTPASEPVQPATLPLPPTPPVHSHESNEAHAHPGDHFHQEGNGAHEHIHEEG